MSTKPRYNCGACGDVHEYGKPCDPTTQDTTSIDELISNLTCATHFLTEEDCIYCDRKKIKALISDQITKARINEANIGLANNESSHHKQLERIAYLNGVKNK